MGVVVVTGDFVVAGTIGEHTIIGMSFLKFPPKKRCFIGVMRTNSTLQNLADSTFFVGSEVTEIRSAFYKVIPRICFINYNPLI